MLPLSHRFHSVLDLYCAMSNNRMYSSHPAIHKNLDSPHRELPRMRNPLAAADRSSIAIRAHSRIQHCYNISSMLQSRLFQFCQNQMQRLLLISVTAKGRFYVLARIYLTLLQLHFSHKIRAYVEYKLYQSSRPCSL